MDTFQLDSRFKPAGDQPEAIRQMVEGLEAGLSHQTLLGVTGSGKTFSIANVIAQVQRPTLVLAPNKTLAAQLYGEFKTFFPHNSVEYFVSYYDYYQPEAYVPSSDTYIEKDSSINDHIEQMRLSATKALLERPDAIIVATVSSIYGLGDPASYLKMVLHLDRGDRIDQRELLRRLTSLQYTRNDMDFARATFRVRGDVIDIFPAESDLEAIRVELFDDEVESLSAFDPLTGEVIRKLPRFTFYPKSHYVTPRETLLEAVDQIKAELKERLDYLRNSNKLVEAQRLEQRTRFDLEMILELGYCPEIEVRPAMTQVDDLLSQIRQRVAKNERVLVTTLTKRMAEDLTDYLGDHDVRVRYLHSDIDTVERVEIIRDLRAGAFDVLVGINLLREGLDMPEVSLVAILDADKEGFLRSERSLIQTIGRAARNLHGKAILYADNVTGSMQRAIDETERRRAKQIAFNQAHGIVPKGVRKDIKDILEGAVVPGARGKRKGVAKVAEESGRYENELRSPSEISKRIRQLEEKMYQLARDLEFEAAAQLRDEIQTLRERLVNV